MITTNYSCRIGRGSSRGGRDRHCDPRLRYPSTSESLNPLTKLEISMAWGIRIPVGQCRRVRTHRNQYADDQQASDSKVPWLTSKGR
jgi:hypothetical protein